MDIAFPALGRIGSKIQFISVLAVPPLTSNGSILSTVPFFR